MCIFEMRHIHIVQSISICIVCACVRICQYVAECFWCVSGNKCLRFGFHNMNHFCNNAFEWCKFKCSFWVQFVSVYRMSAGCIRHYTHTHIHTHTTCTEALDFKIMWHFSALQWKRHVNICSCISSFMWLLCLW